MNTEITKLNQEKPIVGVGHNSKKIAALREYTKIERREFTDAIKEFCTYVDKTGATSTAPQRAYSNFTRKVYAKFGLNKKQIEARLESGEYLRDNFTSMEMLFVQAAERAVTQTLWTGMHNNNTRKEIKAAINNAIGLIYSSFDIIAKGEHFHVEKSK